MKVLKRTTQRNVILCEDFYTPAQLRLMEQEGKIYHFGDVYRVSLQDCSEIKVVCKDGFYSTVVVMHDGTILYVVI